MQLTICFSLRCTHPLVAQVSLPGLHHGFFHAARSEVSWYADQIKAYLEASGSAPSPELSAILSAVGLSLAAASPASPVGLLAASSSLAPQPGCSFWSPPSAPLASSPSSSFFPLIWSAPLVVSEAMATVSSPVACATVVRVMPRPTRPSSAPPPSLALRDHFLDSSLAEGSLRLYRPRWEAWCAFAASHRVLALPLDEYAVEQFVVELAEEKKSMSVVNASVAAINHFCSRNKFESPLRLPYFALVLRGVKNEVFKSPVPGFLFLSSTSPSFLGSLSGPRTCACGEGSLCTSSAFSSS
jgi:hypothetical protein